LSLYRDKPVSSLCALKRNLCRYIEAAYCDGKLEDGSPRWGAVQVCVVLLHNKSNPVKPTA
jgi:hypothetical protein